MPHLTLAAKTVFHISPSKSDKLTDEEVRIIANGSMSCTCRQWILVPPKIIIVAHNSYIVQIIEPILDYLTANLQTLGDNLLTPVLHGLALPQQIQNDLQL